ncbi:MAG: sensor histidine kinase, partial [Chloroflexota bacterium]|nr:sensor histidine kinase [Chloroflexota bacterium]
MQIRKARRVGSVQIWTTLQLFISFFIVCTIATALGGSGNGLLAILFAPFLGLLLTFNIPYGLHLLAIILERQSRGLPVEKVAVRSRWPLHPLFTLVNSFNSQADEQVQRVQQTVQYRDQLLQQVSKTAAQEERNRLARDLHDSIKQQIFSVVMSAAAAKARWGSDPAGAQRAIDDILHNAQEAQIEMQAMLQELRPSALENVGLIESLRTQCQALEYRTGAEVHAELGELPPDDMLPIGAQEMLFRIVQEGCSNIARHARASHIWLNLHRQDDVLLLELGDDGQGFDIEKAHTQTMGLSNVRERGKRLGGTVTIWSKSGQGTTLHVCIPLIDPLQSSKEQEEQNEEITVLTRKTRRSLILGVRMAELAAIVMLLAAPLQISSIVLALCILLAIGAYVSFRRRKTHLTLSAGRSAPQLLTVRAEGYGLLAGILLLCSLYMGYLHILQYRLIFPASDIGTLCILLAALFALFMLIVYFLRYRMIGRTYQLLSLQELQEKTTQRLQLGIVDFCAWAMMAVVIFFYGRFTFTLGGSYEEVNLW